MNLGSELALVVVGGQVVGDQFARSVGVNVVGHVVTLVQHIVAHLVEGRGRNEVALTVNLPGDGRVGRADRVGALGTSGRSGVLGNVLTVGTVLDHTAHEVGVVVSVVVDNGKDLGLDTDLAGGGTCIDQIELFNLAKDTVVEGSLVLVGGSTGTSIRVGPVNFVGFTNYHVLAVLPHVGRGKHGV